MARGLWSWEEGNGADAVEWARVETEPGQWTDMRRSTYDALGLQPPYLDLRPKHLYLEEVAERFGSIPT